MEHTNAASVPLSVTKQAIVGGQTPGSMFVDALATQTGNIVTGVDGNPRAIPVAGAQPLNTGAATNDFIQPLVTGTAILVDATASALRIRLKTYNGSGAAQVQRVSLGFAQAVSAIAINGAKGSLLGAAPAAPAPCTIDVLTDLEDVGELDVTVTFGGAGTKVVSVMSQFTQLNTSVVVT